MVQPSERTTSAAQRSPVGSVSSMAAAYVERWGRPSRGLASRGYRRVRLTTDWRHAPAEQGPACTLATPRSAPSRPRSRCWPPRSCRSACSPTPTGATVDKTGWWNRANSQTSTPAGPVTVPPPPGIPTGDLVVGTTAAEPSAILAVGIQPDDGSRRHRRPLHAPDHRRPRRKRQPGHRRRRSSQACPITEFWAGGDNGTWDTRPAYDCEAASAPGDARRRRHLDLRPQPHRPPVVRPVRHHHRRRCGRWSPLPRPPRRSRRCSRAATPSTSTLDAEPAPGSDGDDPFATPTTFADAPEQRRLQHRRSAAAPASSRRPSSPRRRPRCRRPTPDVQPTSDADESATAAWSTRPDRRACGQPGRRRSSATSRPIVLLAFPLLLGLMLVISYWFGAAGQPVTTIRQRGVSRALEARARATKGL